MQKKKYSLFLASLFIAIIINARSIHRPKNPLLPSITTFWHEDSQGFTLADSHWEPYPVFRLFDQSFFNKRLLPTGALSFRNNKTEKVMNTHLNTLIEDLLNEIKKHKKKYSHFTVLQKKDFNRRRCCGLMILKFNNYPFVLKIFIETPDSFINPWCKGREPIFFFYMGGGVNRHLTGLTRIKNLEIINKKLKKNAYWNHRVSTPRKWHWLPKNPKWIYIHGKNIGNKKEQKTKIPGIYGIIADYIESNGSLSLMNPYDRKTALTLCNDLDMLIDPHIQNFFIERATKKLVIVDTEHFPTVVGFKEEKKFNNYFEWYLRLSAKCAKNMFFRTKDERKQAQITYSDYELKSDSSLFLAKSIKKR